MGERFFNIFINSLCVSQALDYKNVIFFLRYSNHNTVAHQLPSKIIFKKMKFHYTVLDCFVNHPIQHSLGYITTHRLITGIHHKFSINPANLQFTPQLII